MAQEYTGTCAIFGCSKCLAKALIVDHCRQYLQHTTDAPKRTKENSIFFAQMAHTYITYTSVCGVKGLSLLSILDKFDYISDCIIDSIHYI